MKKKPLIFLSLSLVLGGNFDVEARAGGGGGGRGGGRDYEGSHNVNRTPSMSRSSNMRDFHPDAETARRNQPSYSQEEGRRLAEQRNYTQNPATRNQLNQFLQQSKASDLNRQGRNANLQNIANANQRAINPNTVQNALDQNRAGYKNWFNSGFFNQHGYNPVYARSAANMWRAANWTAASSWLGAEWGEPIYYSDDESSSPPTSQPQGIQTTTNIFNTTPPATSGNQVDTQPVQGDWLPLGVFAVGKDENALTNASMFLQLALNKNGDIAGTYYNALTDKTYQVDGLVDNQTQVTAIKMSDNPSSPILKTGIYNLTQDQTPVTVFFPNGSQQTWQMVRLQQ